MFDGETIKQLEQMVERVMNKSLADAGLGNGHGSALTMTERQQQAIQRTVEQGNRAIGMMTAQKDDQDMQVAAFSLNMVLEQLRKEFGL